jgi:hypothetical protein
MAVFFVMRAHNIPGMKRKKMTNGLVSAMIHDYMAATTSASSQRLASFLGDEVLMTSVYTALSIHY